ncbi:tRNA (guanine-N(7)-)-methyltransferase [Marinithermofilum abyssi]|uniref:tRNA (guanine-N(7)-)-methyltransferase n=1 Tax=Marinithermofilum abyssi TaxID=1571185 RepID=A0A8J2Y9C9_9BACL|nr:tRNA (guanosine(46)-N7)-methyltransferase TrmB [Marinithermofilum abyssi]GGE19739.1 tRNA (guanine-N(7)-)-methyltransferase [Marinithermofilum abyssi]
MRLRRKPEAKQKVMEHPLTVMEPEKVKGRWRNLFGNDQPIYMELGTGKGRFLSTVCQVKPGINWIGVERIEEVLLQALQKAEEAECENLRFLWMDIRQLDEAFAENEADRIYLHFSDPWPKKRHAKRRLTYSFFLEKYKQVLRPGGHVILKTDNEQLFDFSLEQLEAAGFRLLEQTRDLHNSPFAVDNVMTEYEEKFVSRGMPIYFLMAENPGK